jgi:DNA-binding LacI/PurR family transcriptional regulator
LLDQLVHRNDIPMVLAEFKLDDPKASTILLDYKTGIHAAVNHLVEAGPQQDRLPGRSAQAALRHHPRKRLSHGDDRPPGCRSRRKWIIECDHTLKGGVAGFASCRRSRRAPPPFVCSNDMTAIGVLRAAYMEGLRVPHDLSVIGLDDIDFAEFTLPPLTTIRLSRTDLARAAFEALRQQAEDPGNPKMQREFLVSTSLVYAHQRPRRRRTESNRPRTSVGWEFPGFSHFRRPTRFIRRARTPPFAHGFNL